MTEPETRTGTDNFSACDQIVRVKRKGFSFNSGGELMGRVSINNPDEVIEIEMKEGVRLSDALPQYGNGISILTKDIELVERPVVLSRNLFACGGYSYDRKLTEAMWG